MADIRGTYGAGQDAFERSVRYADNVEHPSHYTWLKDVCGIEVIDICRHLDFVLGNAVKYILRAGHKQESGMTARQKQIEDLRKAVWYLQDKINTLEDGK